MKKLLYVLILVALTGCFGKTPEVKTGKEGKPMPSFNLLLMDSITRLNTSSIPTGQPIVLFLFNPYCPYCRAQTEEITKEIKSLSNIRFYFFSIYSHNEIKGYYKHYQLSRFTNISVGQDYDNYFGNYYPVSGVPYLAIYDINKKLKKVLIGKVGINLIKDIAFEQ
jgi:thiol-disulfide isomerase/thioredoxin